jgi:hypothetical protein
MKTQIIQIEPHDDIISARDKMGWSQTGRILLVWPKKGRVLHRKIDLILLQRHSQSIGAQLALVSRDPEVRYQAIRLAIPTFKDVRKAKRAHWRVDKHVRREISQFEKGLEEHKQKTRQAIQSSTLSEEGDLHPQVFARPDGLSEPLHPLLRTLVFILGIMAILSISAAIFPHAQISLNARSTPQEITIGVRAEPEQEKVNLSGILPSRSLQIIVDGEQSLPVEGVMFIPDESATGRVLFSNITHGPIHIPEGTIIRSAGTDPIRFATTRSGDLPAGPEGQITLPVQAIQPGEKGNLPARSLNAVEGPLGLNLTAINPLPTRDGKDRPVNAPEPGEYDQLFDELSRQLYFNAVDEAQNLLASDDMILTVSPQPAQVLVEEYDPIDPQPSDLLNLSLSLEFTAWYVSGEDLKALAEGVLDANLSPDLVPIQDSLQISRVSAPKLLDGGTAQWQMKTSRETQLAIDENRAANLVLGMPLQQASDRIAARFDLYDEPQIRVYPQWWPRIPLLPFRVSFDIN